MTAIDGARNTLQGYLNDLDIGIDVERQRYNAAESLLHALNADADVAHRHLAHVRDVLRTVVCYCSNPLRHAGWIARRLYVVRDLLDTSGRHARNVAFAEECLANPARLTGNNVGQLFVALIREGRDADVVALANLCSGARIPVEPCTIQRMTDYYELCFPQSDAIRHILTHVGTAARDSVLLQSWRGVAGELPESVTYKLCGAGSDQADGLEVALIEYDALDVIFRSRAFATLDVFDSIAIEQRGLHRRGMMFLPAAIVDMIHLRNVEQIAAGHV